MEDTLLSTSRALPLFQDREDANLNDSQRLLYLSNAQWRIYNLGSRVTFIKAGRGFGKTSIMALRTVNCAQTIPLGCGIFLGSSIKSLYTRVVPNLVKSIEKITGLREGVHFFRGRPPQSANFPMPLARPRNWENVFIFYTGHVLQLVSMEVSAPGNGLNLTEILSDEVRFQPYDKIKEHVVPALRGDVYDHPGWKQDRNPYYLSQFYCSDAGLTAKEQVWENEENDLTDEVNAELASMIAQLELCPELAQLPQFIDKLNRLRCQSKYFFNFSSVENVEILTPDYLKRMERQLPKLIFDIQVLGKRRVVNNDGYYSNFDEEIHTYLPCEADENNAIHSQFDIVHRSRIDIGGTTKEVEYEAPDLGGLALVNDCRLNVDIDDGPLYITFDFNKNINTLVVAQRCKMNGLDTCKVVRCMYTLNERKLRALCSDFHKFFEPHMVMNRKVVLYYDSTAKQGGAYALENANETKYFNVIKEELEKRGWSVHLVFIGNPMAHSDKFRFINDVFAGNARMVVRINREECQYLIASLENSKIKIRVKNGATVLMKDKSTEKKSGRSEEEKIEDTDMSDAFDTMVIGMYYHADGGVGYFGMPGMMVSLPVIG